MKLSLIETIIVLQHRKKLTTGAIAKQLGISRVYLYKILSYQLAISDRVEASIRHWLLETLLEDN